MNIEIKNICLITLLSTLNNNLISMEITEKTDSNVCTINQNDNLYNLPNEIIYHILQKLTQPYIDYIEKIDNIFDFENLDINNLNQILKKVLSGPILSSKILNILSLNLIEKINNLIKTKKDLLINKIKKQYENMTKNDLNIKLKTILSKSYYISINDLNEALNLIYAGADINIQNNNKDTLLILATKNSAIDIIKLLLKNNADINIQNQDLETPLIIAVKKNNLDIIKLLLNTNQVNIHQTDIYGFTALHWALFNHNEYIFNILTRYSILNNQTINYLESILSLAESNNITISKEMLEILRAI